MLAFNHIFSPLSKREKIVSEKAAVFTPSWLFRGNFFLSLPQTTAFPSWYTGGNKKRGENAETRNIIIPGTVWFLLLSPREKKFDFYWLGKKERKKKLEQILFQCNFFLAPMPRREKRKKHNFIGAILYPLQPLRTIEFCCSFPKDFFIPFCIFVSRSKQ